MLKLIKRFTNWRDRRRLIKTSIQSIRRSLQLLGEKPEKMTDQQVIVMGLYVGSLHFESQCIVQSFRAGTPNVIIGRVVEVPMGKNQIH